jgi:hypothetical protein
VGEKELLVGFEAESPYNSDLDPIELFPNHPHIRNFKVVMNGEPLSYDIAHMTMGDYNYRNEPSSHYVLPPYYKNGKIQIIEGWVILSSEYKDNLSQLKEARDKVQENIQGE